MLFGGVQTVHGDQSGKALKVIPDRRSIKGKTIFEMMTGNGWTELMKKKQDLYVICSATTCDGVLVHLVSNYHT